MNETIPKSLPETVRVSTLAKWLDTSDKNPQIRFRLQATGPKGKMDVDYSGGILAFSQNTEEKRLHCGFKNIPIRLQEAKEFVSFSPRESMRKWMNRNPSIDVCRDDLLAAAYDYFFKTAQIHPLNVIHFLLLDMDAGEMSFDDFCSDFGHDVDSRKAFAIWETCNRQGAEFRTIMSVEIESLRELTADL